MEMTEKDKVTALHLENADSAQQHQNGAVDVDHDSRMGLEVYLALAAISSQYVVYVMTLLMPSTILSYINADLGPDPNYTWITVSWNVAASVMVTVGGRLSDIFGRRYFMITGAVIGLCGAAVGATSHSINQMIVSGILFGIGGGLQEMAYACIQEMVPNRYRVFAIGCFELSATFAFISPMIAYAMLATTSIGWRTVYWFLFGFETFGLALVVLFYKPPTFHTKHREDGKTRMQLLREMDFVGLFLFAAGCASFLVGINWGGRQYAWRSGQVISTLIIGIVLLVGLGLYEVYAKPSYPILPPKLFRRVRDFTMVLVICFVGGMLYYSMNVLWPRQSGLLFVPSDTPLIAGAYANILSFGTIIAGFVVVFFSQRVGHERWQQVGFMTVQTALIGSLASVGINDKVQAIVTVIVLGTTITPPQLLAFAMISMGIEDQADIGIANGLASTFRLLGGAVATAIYTAILSGEYGTALPARIEDLVQTHQLPSVDFAPLLQAGTLNTAVAYNDLLELPGVTTSIVADVQLAVKSAYVQAFKLVYLVAIAFGGIAIMCAAFTKSIPREKKTMARAVRMENESPKQESVPV